MMEAAQELFFQSKFAEVRARARAILLASPAAAARGRARRDTARTTATHRTPLTVTVPPSPPQALSGFEAALDDLEGEATHSRDASAPDWRGSCLSNMAACEHHLGHWEAAAGLYGRALAELWEAKRRRKPIERVEEVAKGVAATKGIANKAAAVTEKGATERRIDFISGRLRLVERRERPPMGKILDKDAREACFENRAPPQPQPPAVAPPRAAGPPIATRPAEEAPPPVAAEASADGGYEPYEGPIV